ncbi:unnamed protein product [Parnassius mnemosyne]|uniref:PHD-type domain-containing protein n=1 Tax=Parnassius mnemosyne TaxID=213953 RepID=A0AAV1M1Y8_9NEOP
MITCVACLNEIHNNSGRIDCARCKQYYHNLCINISDKNLKKMSDTQKASWQCPNCPSKQPRGDNTNTPVKQTASSSSSGTASSNVTTRKATKAAGESSIPQVLSSGALTSSAEIRDIINEALREWATGICTQLNEIRSEVVSLKDSMSFFNEQFEQLNAEVKAQKAEVRRLSDENSSLRRDVINLTTHCNQMDQMSRAVNLELQCVPEHKNENVTRIVQQLESWLNDTVFDHELLDARYDIFRRDRSSTLSFQTKKEGGGICLAVLKKYRALRMNRWESACEELWVSIDLGLNNKYRINMCAAYIPPPVSRDYLTTFLNNLTDVVNNKISNGSFTLLVGDFNLPYIVWESIGDQNVYIPEPNNGTIENMFIDEITFNNLKQCNYILNDNNRILDLVLVDNANIVKVAEASLPLVGLDPHHPALEILIHSLGNIKPCRSKRVALPNYSKCNFDAINEELTHIVWSEVWSDLYDIDSMVDKFYGTVLPIIKKHTPH